MSKEKLKKVEKVEDQNVEPNEGQEQEVPEQTEEIKKKDKKKLAGIITGALGAAALAGFGVVKAVAKIHSTDDPMDGIGDLTDIGSDSATDTK